MRKVWAWLKSLLWRLSGLELKETRRLLVEAVAQNKDLVGRLEEVVGQYEHFILAAVFQAGGSIEVSPELLTVADEHKGELVFTTAQDNVSCIAMWVPKEVASGASA